MADNQNANGFDGGIMKKEIDRPHPKKVIKRLKELSWELIPRQRRRVERIIKRLEKKIDGSMS